MEGSIRVLVVDDEPPLARLVAEYLPREDDRLTVETATDAHEGLNRLEQTTIDCVVSDYDMPGMDGIGFLETVRDANPTLPFILYTGKGSEEVAGDAISAGVTDYLQKETGTDQYTLLANRITNAVERTRAEQARDRHLAAIENATEGISILDADGRFVYVNETYADLYGYDTAELLGEHWELVYPDEEIPVAREQILPTVERERYWHGETTGLRADGSTFVEDHTLATTDDGELICVVSDISDRKAQASELHRLRERFERFADVVPNGFFLVSADYLETYFVNSGIEDIYGISAAEAAADPETWLRHVHPDDRTELQQSLRRQQCGSAEWPVEQTFRIQHPAHGLRWVLTRVQPIRDQTGAVVELAGVATDVTARKRREADLDAARERYESLFENNPLAIWEEDFSETKARLDDLRDEVEDVEAYLLAHPDEFRQLLATVDVIDVNQNAVEYYGAESKQDLLDSLDRVFTEDAYEVLAAEFAAIANGDRRFRGDTVYRSFDGERHDEMLDLYVPESAAEDYSHVFITGTDITERKRKERELRRERDRLDEFAGFVSHDLRGPLSIASGYLELACTECESDALPAIGRALDRMDQLITDLLTLAREGETVGAVAPVSLCDLVPRCWQHVETAEARLVVESPPTVRADRSRLTTLLENLFRNAVEHGGTDVTITVGELVDGEGFYVADDGPGIPRADRSTVFEAGYSKHSDGTGLGLAIVEQIAEAHGWEVSVTESTHGGARFEVTGDDTDLETTTRNEPRHTH
ncbi:hybrid sensor histidine kinase/response regulator [Salinigranum halophilum]|uniref:hybrid sensor histidine kinase/response regulator n=1 Tax=Salinigranum halophilum TaxID=2565931 RepID=UPI00191BFD6B|nr:PAS domain S-box protein [Salinigranum halophilum]